MNNSELAAKNYSRQLYPNLGYSISLLVLVSALVYGLTHYLIFGKNWQVVLVLGTFAATALSFFPRKCFYLFFFSIAIYFPYQFGQYSIQPVDIFMGILTIAVFLDYLLNINSAIRSAYFDIYFLLLITATIISSFFAYNSSYSIIPIFRIFLIYIAFRIFFKFALKIGVRKLLDLYLLLVAFLSAVNILNYMLNFGELRIFGMSWLTYETYSMTAISISFALFLWSYNKKERMKYGLICLVVGFGIVATQSRAPLLAIIITSPFLIGLSYLKAYRERTRLSKGNIRIFMISAVVVLTAFIFLKSSLFSNSIVRYEQFIDSINQPQGTIAYRVLQWTAAYEAFKENPITGIGIGNFKLIAEILPTIRSAELWDKIENLSVHNVFLQYLAETGIIGAFTLLLLIFKGLIMGYRPFKKKLSLENNQVSVALFISMFIIFHTIFYMRDWTWGQTGYLLSFFFGLTAAWNYQLENKEKLNG